MFDDLPTASIVRFQAHINDFGGLLQHEIDRLHAVYPRFSKAQIDVHDVCAVAPQLFALGQIYVSSLGHGVDCPVAHPEIIAEAIGLFERLCLGSASHVGLYGGVSSGKSSVLALLRLLIGPLCALTDRRYAPLLVHDRYRSTVETSHDLIEAFKQLYGGIKIIREDGTVLSIGRFTQNVQERFGKTAVQPITSPETMQDLKRVYVRHGLQPVVLCDNAHRLAQFDCITEKLWLGPSIETIMASFGKAVVATQRPELLPISCDVRPITRSVRYATPNRWHRGVKVADAKPVVSCLAYEPFVDPCKQVATIIDNNPGSMYLRVGMMSDVDRIVRFLGHRGIDAILCDRKIERSDVSDWVWDAYRYARRCAIISYGSRPRFHRALPTSVSLFVDLTRESSSLAIPFGMCASASGYDRSESQIIMSRENLVTLQARDAAHARYGRTGTVRMRRINGHAERRIDSLCDGRDDFVLDVPIDDLCRTIDQQGRIRVNMYGLEA